MNRLLRLPQVLAVVPVSRASWYAGIKAGRYPRPVPLGPRSVAWRARDVMLILENGTHE